MQQFIATLIQSVGIQIIGVFGIFFVFGYLLSFLQSQTHANYRRSVGWRGILFTAWVGTPIHELGHAFLAKLFRHRVTRVSLFRPNEETGGLGHVEHEYNARSLYQRIGNFFIGAAPMIFGGLALFLLLIFLVPNGDAIFALAERIDILNLTSIFDGIQALFFALFSKENVNSWQFWLFVYLSFCVVSHIAPSPADRRGMWHGFAFIVAMLVLVNLVALLLKRDITDTLLSLNRFLSPAVALYIYAVFLSFVHLVASTVLLFPFRKK